MYILNELDNGIKVVMERIEYVDSVTIGILIDNGSVNEDIELNGVSHFIEHMLFKGTKKRTPKEIAETIDDIGGQINAFTGKEQTCYYAKVLNNHLDIAIDVLADMLNDSLFLKEDIEKEKNVIIEEINMYEDSPDDLVFELLNEIMFKGTSLEFPILGTEKSIAGLNRENILNYFQKNYNADDIVISIAGKFDPDFVMNILNTHLGRFRNEIITKRNKVNHVFKNKIKGINKKIEQLNICLGLEGVHSKSDDIHPILVLNNIFGGSMSSRLFQNIREERGLVYSIDSHLSTFDDTGTFSIYAGLNQEYLFDVLKLVNDEIDSIKKNMITEKELVKSKEQLKGNYILGMEGTFNRMFENARSISLLGRIETPQEVLSKIDNVTMEDIERVVNIVFNKDTLNFAYVGNIKNAERTEEKIKKIFRTR